MGCDTASVRNGSTAIAIFAGARTVPERSLGIRKGAAARAATIATPAATRGSRLGRRARVVPPPCPSAPRRSESPDFFLAAAAFENHLIEPLAGNEFHDEEIDSCLGVGVVNRRDVRMIEFGKGERFVLETPARIFVGQAPERQHLQRDVPIETLVVRAIHVAHAPGTDPLQNSACDAW